MPLGWMIFAIILFFAVMFALKVGIAFAVNAWGAWIAFVGISIALLIGFLIDRSDKKKKAKLEEQPETAGPSASTIKESFDAPHRALGLSPGADPVVLQAAYRALAKKYHPDTTEENAADARRRFAEISDAYAILSKSRYDEASKKSPPNTNERKLTAPILAVAALIAVTLAGIVLVNNDWSAKRTAGYSSSELSEMTQKSLRELGKLPPMRK